MLQDEMFPHKEKNELRFQARDQHLPKTEDISPLSYFPCVLLHLVIKEYNNE